MASPTDPQYSLVFLGKKSDSPEWGIDLNLAAFVPAVVEFLSLPSSHPRHVFLAGGRRVESNAAFESVVEGIGGLKEFSSRQCWGVGELIEALPFSIFMERTSNVLPRVAHEILKYTTRSNVYGFIGDSRFRLMADFIHRQRRASAPVTLRAALSRFGLTPAFDTSELDVDLNAQWAASKGPAGTLAAVFELDIEHRPEVLSSMDKSIVRLNTYSSIDILGYEEITSRWNVDSILWFDSNAYRVQELPTAILNERSVSVNFANMREEDFRDEVKSFSINMGRELTEAQLENIVDGSSLRGVSGRRMFGPASLFRAAEAISKIEHPNLSADIEPKAAPLDVTIVGQTLRLAGAEPPESGTPLDLLEALRADHKLEIDRIAESLQGANTGPGFSARIQRVRQHLSEPLTQSSSLLLATHVRALEDIFPAVREVLSDVTAADVGATISGLGLFVRQFPAWRKFLEEAREQEVYTEDNIRAIDDASENLAEQPSSIVEERLSEELRSVQAAASENDDPVLRFGQLRATGNAYRAMGRYLRGRLVGVSEEFNKSIDKKAGELLAQTVFGGIILASSDSLTQLATAYPNEFGWILGLLAVLTLAGKR